MVSKETMISWMTEDGGAILRDPRNQSIITGYVTFTPERAKAALENNTHNRPMKTTHGQVPSIKDVLEKGLWDANVSKINFEESGVLSDGQHRLAACVVANIPIRCLVTWGIGREAQLVTDRRGARKMADDLAINGKKNATNLAATTRMIYAREVFGLDIYSIINKGQNMSNVSDVVLYDYYTEHSEVIDEVHRMIERIYASVRYLKINRRSLNLLAYEFAKISNDDAEGFWKRLASGVSKDENDPIMMLHKRLFDRARSNTLEIPRTIEAALIIKAWNAYITGEQMLQLKYRSGGDHPEPFPEIKNPYDE